MKLILCLFEGMTSLVTNFAKTCRYSSTVRELPQDVVAETLNCEVGLVHATYLGVPILGRRP